MNLVVLFQISTYHVYLGQNLHIQFVHLSGDLHIPYVQIRSTFVKQLHLRGSSLTLGLLPHILSGCGYHPTIASSPRTLAKQQQTAICKRASAASELTFAGLLSRLVCAAYACAC